MDFCAIEIIKLCYVLSYMTQQYQMTQLVKMAQTYPMTQPVEMAQAY